jgi:hypothetical protein
MKAAAAEPEAKLVRSLRRSVMRPADDEWQFARVPNEEAEFCFLYEYGRRAKKFRTRVEAWRKRHPQIVKAAQNLLARIGPFARPFGEQGKTHTKRDIQKAKESGKAWAEWMRLTMGLVEGLPQASDKTALDLLWPDGLHGDDPRLFLYYFPPFPREPWLKIQPERVRRLAFPLLTPQPASAQNLRLLILTAGRDLSAPIERQRQLQEAIHRPMDKPSLESMVRADIGKHIFAPALREGGIGPALPACAQFDLKAGWLKLADVVHQEAQFVVNWAESDKAILKALKAWLKVKGRRPHKELKKQNLATAREHLNKLSALRLLAKLSYKDAAEVLADTSGYQHHKDERVLRRQKSEAETLLRTIFPE